ncbi:carboxypeptidase B-like [Dendronephthya gigantea]|uniref:carboxypeptidase B-like n=1 Tax=Dendronephthya gigantea TaxID=151771 RepID=UPI00106DBD7E|nr:carboxypeptidase B-like [Dendronephthya gigantea]
MAKFVLFVTVLVGYFIFSKVQCYSNLELLEKQKPGEKPFVGHKVIRTFPKTKADIDFINSLEENPDIEVDFWSRSRNIDIHVTPEDYTKLDAYLNRWNINYDIINNDLQKSFEEEEKGHYRHCHSWHRSYHNFEEIIQKMSDLSPLSKGRATLLNIGLSAEGRNIRGLEITGNKLNMNKQKIVVICGQHAREWISPATCVYIMENMILNYGKDSKITGMLNRFNWVFFPVVNPDGYVYTWKKDRLWRKNRQSNNDKSGCHGTDLNRNWGYHFAGSGSSNNTCSDIYHGKSAFSAPEVMAVANYIKANRDHVFGFLDIHSYSQLLMYPWSYSKDVISKDKEELHDISLKAADAIKSLYGTTFETGPAAAVIYEAAGSGKDWVYGSMGVKFAFVFELRDKGKHGFLLPASNIIPTAKETIAAFHSMSTNMKDYENKSTNY